MGQVHVTSDITVIVLTYNESKHIRRCLDSVRYIAKEVFIVDSFSTDDTVKICEAFGANVYQNPFVNQAVQFNWALKNCPIKTEWVMRLDADEYLLPDLVEELEKRLPELPDSVAGIYLKRRVYFQGRWIRHGGYYPTWLLRVWRHGSAVCEARWMDEHIKLLHGSAVTFTSDFVDDNLHGLTRWTTKHNDYASREVVGLVSPSAPFQVGEEVSMRFWGSQEQRKRWLKYRYARLPLFMRPILYFFYRYVIKFGFLDGKEGLVWHLLQGFWYRFLVDAKLMEIQKEMRTKGYDARTAIKQVFDIEI